MRKATEEDAETLFRWRNDPEARANSFHMEPIPFEEHIAWLRTTLRDPMQEIYIMCKDNISIGQVRLSAEGGTATVSYSIDATYRAQGYGRLILQLAEDFCVNRGKPQKLRGYVKKQNVASQVIFEKLEYVRQDVPDRDCFVYMKAIFKL